MAAGLLPTRVTLRAGMVGGEDDQLAVGGEHVALLALVQLLLGEVRLLARAAR